MVYTKNTPTNHHQQDTAYYCGAATAQMILESIGAGIIDQTTLYNSNHSHNTQSNWYTDPDGLNYTLNAFKNLSPTFQSYFLIHRDNSETDGSKSIVGTIEVFGVATGTLVYGCGHWIAVRGFNTDVNPQNQSYTILGFYINNPWPPVPSLSNPSLAPPPPHSTTDGCGSGGNRGISNEYVTYTQWKSTYLTGCDVWNVGYLQYVSVCDPRKPKLGELVLKHEKRWTKGERLIRLSEAPEFIQKSIDLHGLKENKHFAAALQGATPGQPVLVQRLDLPDTYYYIVPMTTASGITCAFSLDARFGEFQGGQAFTEPIKELFKEPAYIQKELLRKLISHPVELDEPHGKLIIREGIHCIYPVMVWRPCRESRSPYYPFHMITVGNQQIYIGYDGTVYSQLHDLLPGE